MDLYRVTKEKWAGDLSGTGAKLFGGRWNSPGIPALYGSVHRSLCGLETLVHTPLKLIPQNLMLITIRLPESAKIRVIEESELPASWNSFPYDSFTQHMGDELLNTAEYLAIQLPSSVMHEEHNMMLNPNHRNFNQIRVSHTRILNLERFITVVDR